jgi:hypothetical protein
MPRRNRNAGTPRLDADQLAADLALLAADLDLLAVCQAYAARNGYLLVMTGGTQPIPQLTPGSR